MLRRIVIVACFLILADLLLLVTLACFLKWTIPLIENVVSTVIGLGVILYYEFRWSRIVAEHLDSYDAMKSNSKAFCFEKILLFVAGLFMLTPGVLMDVVGLLLLSPSVRRFATHALNPLATCESQTTTALLPRG